MVEDKAKILLVDDQPANLLALEAVLDGLGLSLVKARSGEQALQLLHDQDFAVVLLDVRMPGLDGFETAKLIRNQERSPHTPIIFLTAHDDDRLSIEQAYSLGATDYLVKPLVPVVLRAKVAGFVDLFEKTEQVKRQADQLRLVERTEFERKLADENARFRALTEHNSDAVSLVDVDGTVRYSTPSSRRILGYEPGEFVGRSGFEIVHPDDQQGIQNQLAELVQNPDRSVTVEMRVRHKDGSWRWVECVGTNLLGEPAVRAIVVNFRDISERRRATEALRDSEQRFRQLAENINEVFWMSDPQKSQVLYVSPAYELVWGRSCKSLHEQPRSFLDSIHPEDREHVRVASLERQRRGEPCDVEYRIVRPDGSVRWIRDRSFPVKDRAGRVYRVAGIAEDITERKLAEESLRASEQRFKTLTSHAPVGIFQTDAEGNCLFVNERWCELAGMSPEAAKGQGWAEALHPEDRDRILHEWYTATKVGRNFFGEYRFRTLQGRVTWLSGSALALQDVIGTIIGYIGTVTDITGRKVAEESLKEADRRKDEFLAMLAHELRNPLAPIRNSAQVLHLLGHADPNIQRASDMIERQVEHLARMVDDLLDVSRITRGKVKLQKEPLDLAPVLARAVETCRPLIDARRHELTVALPPDPVIVQGDATRLAQVVGNLLNNAAKYTENGGHIWLTVERSPSEAVVRVRDNGIGIPADLLPKVFDLFIQGDRSLAHSDGGLGIGLTLVKNLVEMQGGTVAAFSEGPCKGSEVVVRLPILERRHGRPRDIGEPEAAPPLPTARRVLVVDDNVDAAESLAMFLTVQGHEVRTAHDGQAALGMAEQFRPEIVLLDIGLPRMDGYEVARRLREQAGLGQVLLVALTGYGQDEDRRKSREVGFDAHVVKPADPATLKELISRPRSAEYADNANALRE